MDLIAVQYCTYSSTTVQYCSSVALQYSTVLVQYCTSTVLTCSLAVVYSVPIYRVRVLCVLVYCILVQVQFNLICKLVYLYYGTCTYRLWYK